MPVDTQQIMDEAARLGQLVAQHPAVARYRQAQRSVQEDPEASRLMQDFARQMETLERQAEAGMHVTDAQRMQLETAQHRLASHLKIKALNLAQMEYVDLLRRVSQTIQRPVHDPTAAAPAPAAGGGAASPGPAPTAAPSEGGGGGSAGDAGGGGKFDGTT